MLVSDARLDRSMDYRPPRGRNRPDAASTVVTITGGQAPQPVHLEAPPFLTIHVADSQGKPARQKGMPMIQVWAWVVSDTGQTAEWTSYLLPFPEGEIQVGFGAVDIDPRHVARSLIEVRVPGCGIGSLTLGRWDGQSREIKLSPGSAIAGKVLDAKGKPITAAELSVSRLAGEGIPATLGPYFSEIITDNDGRFKVENLFPEPCAVSARMMRDDQGHDLRSERIVTPLAEPVEVTISPSKVWPVWLDENYMFNASAPPAVVMARLDSDQTHKCPAITGRVLDSSSGKPIADAAVCLTRPGERSSSFAPGAISADSTVDAVLSAADGTFSLRALSPGEYFIQAQQPDFQVSRRQVVVEAAPLAPIVLKLERLPVARLRLLRPDGSPVPIGTTAQVNTHGADPDAAPESIPVKARGEIEIDAGGVDLGHAQAYAASPGTGSNIPFNATVVVDNIGSAKISRSEWPKTPLTVRLAPVQELNGIVIDARGRPRGNLYIQVQEPGDDTGDSILSGPDGGFRYLSHGGARCTLSVNGYPSTSGPLTVRLAGPRTDVVIAPFSLPSAAWEPMPWAGRDAAPDAGRSPKPGIQQTNMMAVTGRVVAEGSRRPLAGALALLYGSTPGIATSMSLTGADGSFRLAAPGPGAYRVAIAWQGYLLRVLAVTVAKSSPTPLVAKVREDPLLHFRLVGVDGKPAAAGRVRVAISASSGFDRTTAAAHGTVGPGGEVSVRPRLPMDLGSVSGVDAWVRVASGGCARVHLEGWPAGETVVRLGTGCSLDGEVVGSDGTPIANTAVSLGQSFSGNESSFEAITASAETGTDGRFHITGLFPGPCQVIATDRNTRGSADGTLPLSGPVKLTIPGEHGGIDDNEGDP